MTINQIYKLAVDLGIKNDPRGQKTVKKRLKKVRQEYNKLSEEKKKCFDQEKLKNPYSDTRIYYGDPRKKVKRVLTGIDMETSELLLAEKISQEKPIDLIISHHPLGIGLAALHEVMKMQAEILSLYGVPISSAQGLLHIRIDEVSRSVNSANHNRTIDAARILDLPIMSTHTAADNMVANFLSKYIKRNKKNIETVEDLLKSLEKLPEYKEAMKNKCGPRLFAGKKSNFAGKIALTELTGGTEGSKDIYEKMAQAGIDTVVGMHMSEEHKKAAEKSHLNVVIAGHISSDSIGMNLFLDELEKKGVEVIPCSGLIRVKRFKKKKSHKRKTNKKKSSQKRGKKK
ncbi:MAG: Nif3-like dinuclear metal center hexameric protein [Patescibacteria group bacterium]|nr:Nif3-like dinuclear metal center hexameric protein [Patescibacteria group bacterium]